MQHLVLVLSVHKLRSFVFGDSGNLDKVSDNFAKRGGLHSSFPLHLSPIRFRRESRVINAVLAFISSWESVV